MASGRTIEQGTADLASHRGTTAGVTLAAAVAFLALPSAVLGFGTTFRTPQDSAYVGLDATPESIGTLRIEGGGARLARALSLSFMGHAPLYPFTPAKNPNRPDRSVTVAVRVDSQALKTITVLGPRVEAPTASESPLRIAQTGFNLGVARGYRTFSPEPPATAAPAAPRHDATDLAARYSLAPGSEPRFSGRGNDVGRGRSASERDYPASIGGSYRVTRSIDLTAGVRSLQDRERLKPLTDGNLDNQAVYVGTKFKF